MMSSIPGRKPQRLVISSDSISSLEDCPRAQASEDRPRPDNQIGNKQASERSRSKKAVLNNRRIAVLLVCTGMLLGSVVFAYSKVSEAKNYVYTPPGMPHTLAEKLPPLLRAISYVDEESDGGRTVSLGDENVEGFSYGIDLPGACTTPSYSLISDQKVVRRHLSGVESLDGYNGLSIPGYNAFSYISEPFAGASWTDYRTVLYPDDESFLIEINCTHFWRTDSTTDIEEWHERLYELLSVDGGF
ncbi:hypothetical protein [Corynebacterium sp. LK33]|uniref:hypothetical protein n=1 Tax=Corynebacterium sp. LK33 TaxID=2044574 RepID=UPI001651BC4B|nr:hypothetical protein [Corynebacterium sp. LK33]